VRCLANSVKSIPIGTYKELKNYSSDIPVIFRSMAQRKTVATCLEQGRDFYYIDTGYLGNLDKRKDWHRVVKNGMQHFSVRYDLSEDRFNLITKGQEYVRFSKWRKDGDNILIVTPSDKPCSFYGISRTEWLENTIKELIKHTDRKIIIRDKGLRKDRIGTKSIYNQFKEDSIYAVVTYNSIAATESIGYGIPCFTLAPNSADMFCLKDLSKIESPLYEDEDKVKKWQHWLGYCQYTPNEMVDGTVFKLIKEYDLK
jgi:hypothetical protein